MKKVQALPFHLLNEVNDNMYENVIITAKRSKQIIAKNSIDLERIEDGFESTEEMEEIKVADPNQEKAIITSTNEFVNKEIKWERKTDNTDLDG
tara:strand:- start:318 stop:599 length:282 start_codon:yes stop_codon:yes gene_type:complete